MVSIQIYLLPTLSWFIKMKRGFKIKTILTLILGAFFFICLVEASSQNSVQITISYPQESNTPKRQTKRIDEPVVVKDEVFIDIVGIKLEQLNHPELYAEYFLDNNLIYSTEDKKQSPLGFILDTRLYENGRHTLIVNLWDKDGPSAIGIREIIIQNQTIE